MYIIGPYYLLHHRGIPKPTLAIKPNKKINNLLSKIFLIINILRNLISFSIVRHHSDNTGIDIPFTVDKSCVLFIVD